MPLTADARDCRVSKAQDVGPDFVAKRRRQRHRHRGQETDPHQDDQLAHADRGWMGAPAVEREPADHEANEKQAADEPPVEVRPQREQEEHPA